MSDGDARPRGRGAGWPGAALVLGVCALVYWSWLGVSGFEGTEGHRVVPGWTMLESGDLLRVRMFDQTYLRKPPGMPWAIAASAAIFGESEWSARAVSALASTLSALVALVFAGRWFGWRWGVYAGMCQALTPLFWQPGRTADIEAMHNLGVQLATLALVDAFASERRGRGLWPGRSGRSIVAAAGIVLAVLMKGPAGAPALAGVVLGLGVVGRRGAARLLPELGIALGLATAALLPLGLLVLGANGGGDGVKEDVSGFLWSWTTLGKTAELPVAAFIAALPGAAWALFPFGSDARAEARLAGPSAEVEREIARALACSWIASVGVCVLAGLSNPRYAMPGAMLLAPLAAYVAKGAITGAFMPKRAFLARAACLGYPLVLGGLLAGGGVFLAARQANWDPDRAGGPDAGAAITGMLPGTGDTLELWADGLVEARPDVLLYAVRRSRDRRVELRPLWRKHDVQAGVVPPPGALLALRTDGSGDERGPYRGAIASGRLEALGTGRVHKFEFTVYRVRAGP
jgi:4-amino-4-deoxy-L-arabinose transferase-like glycosyltransferase